VYLCAQVPASDTKIHSHTDPDPADTNTETPLHCNCLSALPFVYLPFVFMDLAKTCCSSLPLKLPICCASLRYFLASSPQLSSAFSGCSSSARAPGLFATFVLREIPCDTTLYRYDPIRSDSIRRTPSEISPHSHHSLFASRFFTTRSLLCRSFCVLTTAFVQIEPRCEWDANSACGIITSCC